MDTAAGSRSELHLISFPTCPFVQRPVMLLQEKDVPFEVTYIDLSDPPEWFLRLSPRGKVPALKTEHGPLFESQAICEYIDETTEGSLLPANPYERAHDRAWFQLASEDLFVPLYLMIGASTRKDADEQGIKLKVTLGRLEETLYGRDWLSGSGKHFGMADVACAPFVMRVADAKARGWFDLFEGFPQINAWADRLQARPTLRSSVPKQYAEVEQKGLEDRDSIWLREPQRAETGR